MCQSCFDSEWEDSLLTPTLFLNALSQERKDLMLRAGQLLEQESATGPGPGYWQGDRLHAAIDDDNYDSGPYIRDDEDPTLTPAEQAWMELTVPERSIVVAILHHYEIA